MARTKPNNEVPAEEDETVPIANTARRQEVMDAAANYFAQYGYHGVSTRALADQLGIKVASLYFHFKSKDDALQEICDRGIDSSLEFAKSALSQPPGLEARIRYYFAQMRENLEQEADYINVFIRERRHMSDAARTRIDRKMRDLRKILLTLFEEARAEGDLRDDISPRSANFIMIGTIRHLSQLYVEGPFPDFDEIMHDAIEALLRGLVKGKA